MFEDATFDSRPTMSSKTPQRMAIALAVNVTILTVMLVYPLLYPESLTAHLLSSVLYVPPVPSAPSTPRTEPLRNPATPTFSVRDPFAAPRRIPLTIDRSPGPAPDMVDANKLNGPDRVIGAPAANTSLFHEPAPAVARAPAPRTLAVSSGVAEGLLIFHPAPVYPVIAKATRTAGTVVLVATIDKDGRIANLRVQSGSPLLAQAALDAVGQWRYRPYFLNGLPVAVETAINVAFSLGGR